MSTDRGQWSDAVAEARLRRLEAEIADPIRRTAKDVPGDRSDPVRDRPLSWDAGNGSGPARPKREVVPAVVELSVAVGPCVIKVIDADAGRVAEVLAEGTHQVVSGQYQAAVHKAEAACQKAAEPLTRARRRRRAR